MSSGSGTPDIGNVGEEDNGMEEVIEQEDEEQERRTESKRSASSESAQSALSGIQKSALHINMLQRLRPHINCTGNV
jgi:hypothetical protein